MSDSSLFPHDEPPPVEVLPTREFRPFDPTLVIANGSSAPLRYLETALDGQYLIPVPADWRHRVPPGMLPPQDLELRKEIDKWRAALHEARGFGVVGRLVRRADFKRTQGRADLHARRVRALLRKSPEHFAAATRIAAGGEAAGIDHVVAKPLQAMVAESRRAGSRPR